MEKEGKGKDCVRSYLFLCRKNRGFWNFYNNYIKDFAK